MKLEQIKIGETYLTKIGDRLEPVIVVGQRADSWSKRTKFMVRKLDSLTCLPKLRSAAALREVAS